MALQYSVVERPNPQTKEKKWYAQPKLTGKRVLKDLSVDISETSSLSEGDVLSVMSALVKQLPKWLMEGDSVKLDGFGTFRLSFSSNGETVKENVTASSIKDIYILFEPDDAIKERIQKTKINPAE